MRPSRARTVGSGVLPNYTLDTLFGVKGTIRLVAQSGAPKAHILLKREFYNEESLCPEPIAGIARFTLVANKRFTASKGQTLCLSIEDPAADDDMKLLYGENAVALEFDYDDESDLSEPEDEGEESEDIGVDKHAKNFMAVKEMRRRGVAEMGSLPAKMRKSLAGASTYNTFAERQPPNSLGFPGYPLNTPEPRVLASAATQTERMEDKTPPANALPLKHAEYLSPLSLISNNNHIFHRLDHAQPSAILSPVPYTQSEGSDFQNVVSPPRSPSLMDLSTTTTSLPGSPEDPPWTSSSPTNDQAALPLPSTAATTPTPSPKLELHPQECDSPREVALLMFNDQAEKETKVLHSSIELAKHSISSVPTDPHQDEDMFSLETFFVESQTSSNPIHFPLQPGNRTSFSSSSQSMEDSATLPTPLATPTPLSRSFNTPPKQQTAQLDPPQSEICNVQPSPSTSVQSLPGTSLSSVPSVIHHIKGSTSSLPPSLPPSTAVPKTTRPFPTSIPTQPKAHRLLQAHISVVTPIPQPSISNPLGIRPSLNKPLPKGPRTLQAATSLVSAVHMQPVASTSASTATSVSTKKPVVVGSKWMPLRSTMSAYPSAPTSVLAASTSSTKPAILAPTLKLTLEPSSQSSETTTTAEISTRSKSQLATLDDVLRYTPSPPPNATRNNTHNYPKSESTHSVSSGSIVIEKPPKVLPGFVPAATSIGGLLEDLALREGTSSSSINDVASSAQTTLTQHPNQKRNETEDGELNDDGSITGVSKFQLKVGVKTETQKRKEISNARWAAKAAEEAAKPKEVGSRAEGLPTASLLSLKRPRDECEAKILCHSFDKGKEKAWDDTKVEMVNPSSVQSVEEDMIMETDDENTQNGELPPSKAKVDSPTNSGSTTGVNLTIPKNETPNVSALSITTADQTEDMMIESDEESVSQPLTKKQKIHDSRQLHFVGYTDLRNPNEQVSKDINAIAFVSSAASENSVKPVPMGSTSSVGAVASITPGALLGGLTQTTEPVQKKKRRKKAKPMATELAESKTPCQGSSARGMMHGDASRDQAAQATASMVTDMAATEKAVQAAIEKVEREERERAEKERQKAAQYEPVQMLDMQMSQKGQINSTSKSAKPHLIEPASSSAGSTSKPIPTVIPRLAHPLPAKPVIQSVVDRKLHRPASPMAVPVSTAPVIKTDRGRSSTRSPVRRRTSVNLETPIPRRGRSASINSSRSWESPEARRKRTKSRGRDRSRSYTPSSSRSGSRDVQKYDKGPYCNSRSRSRSRRGRRAQSRRYSTSPLRSPSWSRSRRSTSSIASSRSRSSSVAQKRGRVENSRSRRKSRSRSSRERKRSRSRSRSRTRSRRTSKRKDRYECQAPSPKATDILKIKEEIKEAQLPRPKARFSRVGTVANTDWPATNSNAQFVIKHFDVPANDVSVQQIVFGQQGRMVAVACSDSTIRLWETKPKIREVTQVSTTSAIVGLCWMDGDSGFLTLGVDCQVALHIQKLDKWHSCKLFNMLSTSATTTDVPTCMVYTTGKIAIATLTGVKVWFLTKGVWQQQRDITRSGVTTLKFLPDGNALVGGCKDGLLWYCEVPNGTLRAYAFMPLRKAITAMDMPASSSHLLVTQEGGSAYLVALRLTENKGVIEKTYTSDKVKAEGTGCGAIFATYGQALVFGSTNGCALVWDRKKGSVVYGLKHPEDDKVQAMSSFDGKPGVEGMIVSGTKKGRLFWWPIPRAAPGKS